MSSTRGSDLKWRSRGLLPILAAVAAVALALWWDRVSAPAASAPGGTTHETDQTRSRDTVEEAYRNRLSTIVVEIGGEVERQLEDDRRGSRHQRFILRLPSGHTVLVAHNIDLAPRVPVEPGDHITLRGQYEWNERGGVIHWTHHDPERHRTGGWIRHRGQLYR